MINPAYAHHIMKRLPVSAAIAAVMIICLSLNTFSKTQMSIQSVPSATPEVRPDVLVELTTTEGPVTLRLFGDTPGHQQNFLKLAREGFYDGVLFHRVINDFMVQTGDPDSKTAAPGAMLGMGGPGYELDAEVVFPRHYHKRGALAAARSGDAVNPMHRSNGSQFYIVTGKKLTAAELDKFELNLIRNQKQSIANALMAANRDTIMSMRRNRDREGLALLQDSLTAEARRIADETQLGFTPEQIKTYTTIGGTPHLDGGYTVFGQVESGYDVIDRIQQVAVGPNDRPVEDVRILSVKILEP